MGLVDTENRGLVRCRLCDSNRLPAGMPVAEIAQAAVEVVPDSKLVITAETDPDTRSYRVDFSRARQRRGYEAAWSVPDGAALRHKNILDESMRPVSASSSHSEGT